MLLCMTAIPHAALALTSALDRFEQAGSKMLEAVTGADDASIGSAFVDMSTAKVQAVAAISMIRFSDEMWKALVDLGQRPHDAPANDR